MREGRKIGEETGAPHPSGQLCAACVSRAGGIIEKEWIGEQIQWLWTVRPYIAADIALYLLTAAKEKALKAGDAFRECKEKCPEMVVIPAGTFVMGFLMAKSRSSASTVSRSRGRSRQRKGGDER